MGIAVLAACVDLAFIVLQPESRMLNLVLSATLGASIFAMYPVILAHANDHAEEGTAIQVSGGLLMVFGIGSIVGPLAAGLGMTTVGVSGLFLTSVAAHLLLIAFAVWRMSRRAGR